MTDWPVTDSVRHFAANVSPSQDVVDRAALKIPQPFRVGERAEAAHLRVFPARR